MSEAIAIRIKITPDMVGHDAFILTEPEKYKVSEYGEMIAIKLNPGIDRRSVEQLNLYWSCCGIVAEQLSDNINFNSKKKVDRQCKFSCRFFDEDSKIHFEMRDGGSRLYFELGSTSFDKLGKAEANQYFTDAFDRLGTFLGITAEEMILEAQSRMRMVK